MKNLALLLALILLNGCITITTNNKASDGSVIECTTSVEKPVMIDTMRGAKATVPARGL